MDAFRVCMMAALVLMPIQCLPNMEKRLLKIGQRQIFHVPELSNNSNLEEKIVHPMDSENITIPQNSNREIQDPKENNVPLSSSQNGINRNRPLQEIDRKSMSSNAQNDIEKSFNMFYLSRQNNPFVNPKRITGYLPIYFNENMYSSVPLYNKNRRQSFNPSNKMPQEQIPQSHSTVNQPSVEAGPLLFPRSTLIREFDQHFFA